MKQSYPISFQKKSEYTAKDYRFIEVTIDVMHTGVNKNKSSFTKDVIEKAIPSICNTPILGYVVNEQDDDAKDFKGHEHELRITKNEVKYVYSGQAYGVIPETCNPRWVVRDDGTGVEREYLQVDGLLWTKFDDSVDIFTRDTTKGHSVELTDMVMGKITDKQISPVLDFKFDGCCILSTTDPSIHPAMSGSCITANFSVDDITSQIRERLCEYKAIQKCYSLQENISNTEKGDIKPMTDIEKNEVIEQDFEQNSAVEPVEPVAESSEEEMTENTIENESVEPVVEPVAEVLEPTEEFEENPVTNEDDAQDPSEQENSELKPTEYTLTMSQLWDEIREIIRTVLVPANWCPDELVERYWINDIQENEVIVTDYYDGYHLVGIPYSMNGDNVVLDFDNSKRKKVIYEDWDNGEVLSGTTAIFETLNEKLVKLAKDFESTSDAAKNFQSQLEAYQQAEAEAVEAAEKAKRDELFAAMDEKLSGNAEYTALKEDKELSYSDLEIKCYALIGRQTAEFSYVPSKNDKGTVRFGVGGTQSEAVGAYGGLIERYRANN